LIFAQSASATTATVTARHNAVDVSSASGAWRAASVGQSLGIGDRIRTGEESRASVRLADGSVLQLDELTTIEIKPPREAADQATINLPKGSAYFFNRGNAREVAIETPSANGAIRGTAFVLTVGADGGTQVAMIEGAFELSTRAGRVIAREREQARAGSNDGPTTGLLSDLGSSAAWYLVLENDLSSLRPLHAASRADFFTALPNATTKWRQIAPQLAGAATITRTEWAKEILRSSFTAVGPDCAMRARTLRSVIAAAPDQASQLTELAIALGPGCADAFEERTGAPGFEDEGRFAAAPANQNPPPGSLGGGGGQGNLVAICHNGRTIHVSPAGAAAHLNNHPGDSLGRCQVTPTTNL
jgi:hypothetical protein